jgi:hypothetical protein
MPSEGPSTGPAADAARAAFRAHIGAPGHAVEHARAAIAGLDEAIAAGALRPTPALDLMLGDLRAALEGDAGQPLGGKSSDAARRIMVAIGRELDRA